MKNILKISFHENTNVLICKVWKKIGLSWICENTIFLVTSHRNNLSQSKVKKMRKLCILPKIFLPHLWPGTTVKMRQNTYFIPPYKLYSLCTILSSCLRFSQFTFLLLKLSKPYRPAVWILDILQTLYFIF